MGNLWYDNGTSWVELGSTGTGSTGGGGTSTPTRRFPGDPNPKVTGQTLWGAATGGNANPTPKHEQNGHVLALRRTYFADIPNSSLLQTVQTDHAAGRLPWVSIKISDWSAAASGARDADFDTLIAALESYDKPTWLIINHEPENDGGDSSSGWEATAGADYRGMQRRFRQRMNVYGAAHGGIKRISLGGCLMYYTFVPSSNRNPDAWYPGSGIWDTIGSDHYTEVDQEIDRSPSWTNFVSYANANSIPYTLPEWGLRGEDTNGPTKMQNFYNKLLNGTYDCVAFAYFDSSLNSSGTGWELDNENGLLDKFHQIQADARSVTLADMGY